MKKCIKENIKQLASQFANSCFIPGLICCAIHVLLKITMTEKYFYSHQYILLGFNSMTTKISSMIVESENYLILALQNIMPIDC